MSDEELEDKGQILAHLVATVTTSLGAYWEARTNMKEEELQTGGTFLTHCLGEGSPVRFLNLLLGEDRHGTSSSTRGKKNG